MTKKELKTDFLYYNKKYYPIGTEFIYDGKCELNGEKVILNNQKCKFLYCFNGYYCCFQSGENIYKTDLFKYRDCIKQILLPEPKKKKSEFYFTDEMVISTIWYIIIMFAGVFFKDRIGLWGLITCVYAVYILEEKVKGDK